MIGAGIIGAACAWRLAERGLKVLVLEQGHPAGGSTCRSATGVQAQFTTETNILLSQHCIYHRLGRHNVPTHQLNKSHIQTRE